MTIISINKKKSIIIQNSKFKLKYNLLKDLKYIKIEYNYYDIILYDIIYTTENSYQKYLLHKVNNIYIQYGLYYCSYEQYKFLNLLKYFNYKVIYVLLKYYKFNKSKAYKYYYKNSNDFYNDIYHLSTNLYKKYTLCKYYKLNIYCN